MGLIKKNEIKKSLDRLSIDITTDEIEEKHSESNRYYHTIENHINFMIQKIFELYENGKINEREKDILIIATVFHDIVYDIGKWGENEKKSEKLLKERTKFTDEYQNDIETISTIILDTITHEPSNKLSEIFCDLDMYTISGQSFAELLKTERLIFLEAQSYDFNLYRKKRIKFLKRILNTKYGEPNKENIKKLIEYIENYTPKVGVYADSFNVFDHISSSGLRYLKTYDEKLIEKYLP